MIQNRTPLEDLDELVLSCRDAVAQEYISEAVACYKANAFRSSIIATYLAITYDVIRKLRELELSGDPEAKARLIKFDGLVQANNIPELLNYEKDLIEIASTKLELYSATECVDLLRIKEDRNRCSHPTLNMDGEVFAPSGSLARTHITNAIKHLLARKPTQGKASLNAVFKNLDSELFPSEKSARDDFFNKSPLANARISLVRNFLVLVYKKILIGDVGYKVQENYQHAIIYVGEKYHSIYEAVLTNDLPAILNRIEDKDLGGLIGFLKKNSDILQHIPPLIRGKLENFVSGMSGVDLIHIEDALNVELVQKTAKRRASYLSVDDVKGHVLMYSSNEVYARCLQLIQESASFAEANERISLVTIFSWRRLKDYVFDLIKIGRENGQVLGSNAFQEVLARARSTPTVDQTALEAALA